MWSHNRALGAHERGPRVRTLVGNAPWRVSGQKIDLERSDKVPAYIKQAV